MIYPVKGEDRCVHTVPADRDAGYKVPICIRSLQTGKAKTRLTCLDINSREIIQTFILDTESDKPNIDRVISTKVKINTLDKVNFDVTNYSSKDSQTYSLVSSRPELVVIKNKTEKLNVKETK